MKNVTDNMKRNFVFVVITAILFFVGYLSVVLAQSSVSSGDTNLTVWDSSDSATVYANYSKFFC